MSWLITGAIASIPTALSMASLALGLRTRRDLQLKPIRDTQATKQSKLRRTLRSMDQHHLQKALKQISDRMPNDQTRAELGNPRDYLVEQMDEFIAPTPGQIGALANSLEKACIVW
jgi:hypothetical protein